MKLAASSGRLVEAAAGHRGRQGSNGGHVEHSAETPEITGDLTADALSSLTLAQPRGSSLPGTLWHGAHLLGDGGTWRVPADSALTTLTVPCHTTAGLESTATAEEIETAAEEIDSAREEIAADAEEIGSDAQEIAAAREEMTQLSMEIEACSGANAP